MNHSPAYEEAFQSLNQKQRDAVIHFEGPMMVIAGPGTGKTQLLAIRIAYILANTDTQAHNILALTFTDAGAVAMRQRLLKFIGPDAYKVNIYTYHSFCTAVIQDNIEYFGGYRNLQAASELEIDEILRSIIDTFSYDHVLKRLSGNIYYDRTRLQKVFDTMKKEGWSQEEILAGFEKEMEDFMEDPNMRYKRKTGDYQKGDIKPAELKKIKKRIAETTAAVNEFENYEDRLAQKHRFDFNDMILWVIGAFVKHPELLQDYQERYHYLLVDEYQDTNGSQNDLVFLLANYWEQPNLFVVGDDDQSIYRFQGANMGNLLEFKDRYNPAIIVLENNYRSTQKILESSKRLIEHNNERLVNTEEITKDLIRSRNDDPEEIDVHIHRYINTVHEEKDIVDRIEKLHQKGFDLSRIAVIYRKHSNVQNIIKYLNNKGIPLQIKKEVNVLHDPEIKRLIYIIEYLIAEKERMYSGEHLLFKILHFEYFGIPARDIAKLSMYCSRRTDDQGDDIRWRETVLNEEKLIELKLTDPNRVLLVCEKLEKLINALIHDTPQIFFEKLFTSLGILDDILRSSESTWRMQILNAFFNFIKDESTKNPEISMDQVLEMIGIMNDAEIPLPLVKIHKSNEGVNFTTAHASKGLEFDIVFLIKGDAKNWKARSHSQELKFPKSLTSRSGESSEEDDRRLFYVAMTRARNELYLTYSAQGEDGKELEPCSFVIELEQDVKKHKAISLADEAINSYLFELMRFEQGEIELLDHLLIDQQLENFSLSATGLNKYLKCPLSFYFDNILRVPGARNKWNGFGNAMHYALELFFIDIKNDPSHANPGKIKLFEYYDDGLKLYRSHFTQREYDDAVVYGKENLGLYYDQYSKNWGMAKDYHLEFRIKEIEHRGVPINGMIDRVMEMEDGIFVYDYKTGKKDNKKLKPPLGDDDLGGDYWRQIIFYSLMVKEYPLKDWKFLKGYIPFLEAKDEKFEEKEFDVSEMEQEIVSEQIVQSYNGIQNHQFPGCQEEDCRWCNFVKMTGVPR